MKRTDHKGKRKKGDISISTYGKMQVRFLNDVPCAKWLPSDESVNEITVRDVFTNLTNIGNKEPPPRKRSDARRLFDSDSDEDFAPKELGKRNTRPAKCDKIHAENTEKRSTKASKAPGWNTKKKQKSTIEKEEKTLDTGRISNVNASAKVSYKKGQMLTAKKNMEKTLCAKNIFSKTKGSSKANKSPGLCNAKSNGEKSTGRNEDKEYIAPAFSLHRPLATFASSTVNESCISADLFGSYEIYSSLDDTLKHMLGTPLVQSKQQTSAGRSNTRKSILKRTTKDSLFVEHHGKSEVWASLTPRVSFNSTVVHHAANIEMPDFSPINKNTRQSSKLRLVQSTPLACDKVGMKSTQADLENIHLGTVKPNCISVNKERLIGSTVSKVCTNLKTLKEVNAKARKKKPPVKKLAKTKPIWKNGMGSTSCKKSKIEKNGNDSILHKIMIGEPINHKYDFVDDSHDEYFVKNSAFDEAGVKLTEDQTKTRCQKRELSCKSKEGGLSVLERKFSMGVKLRVRDSRDEKVDFCDKLREVKNKKSTKQITQPSISRKRASCSSFLMSDAEGCKMHDGNELKNSGNCSLLQNPCARSKLRIDSKNMPIAPSAHACSKDKVSSTVETNSHLSHQSDSKCAVTTFSCCADSNEIDLTSDDLKNMIQHPHCKVQEVANVTLNSSFSFSTPNSNTLPSIVKTCSSEAEADAANPEIVPTENQGGRTLRKRKRVDYKQLSCGSTFASTSENSLGMHDFSNPCLAFPTIEDTLSLPRKKSSPSSLSVTVLESPLSNSVAGSCIRSSSDKMSQPPLSTLKSQRKNLTRSTDLSRCHGKTPRWVSFENPVLAASRTQARSPASHLSSPVVCVDIPSTLGSRKQTLNSVKMDLSSLICKCDSLKDAENGQSSILLLDVRVVVTPIRNSILHRALSLGHRIRMQSLGFVDALTPCCVKSSVSRILTASEKVFYECGQSAPISFEEGLPGVIKETCLKLGEGLYGEVFQCKCDKMEEPVALKVIPIEGSVIVNNEKQKTFVEVLPEIITSKELHALRDGTTHATTGFIELFRVSCVRGKYPAFLLNAWDLFHAEQKSENDRPDGFPDDQLYLLLQYAYGGVDVEHFKFRSATQAFSVLQQVCASLSAAEKSLQFEHRDLHWGNILIAPTTLKFLPVDIDGVRYRIMTNGVEASIIDFTLSRLSKGGVTVYQNLAMDSELFTLDSEQDYQFEIYRMMKTATNNNWSIFQPKNNVFWLHYLNDKFCKVVKFTHRKSKAHQVCLGKLRRLQRDLLNCNSCSDALESLRLLSLDKL